jgi:Putative auto-transporter adhesin, head GIN domain
MRRLKAVAGGLLALMLASGCGRTSLTAPTGVDTPSSGTVGSGRLQTESRPVQSFTAVDVGGGGHARIEQTGIESLQITADDNILPLVDAVVTNGRLILSLKPGVRLARHSPIEYHITLGDLTRVDASGASRIDLPNVDSPRLTVSLSGASSCVASGSVQWLEVDLSGASRFEAAALSTRNTHANLSGASYALIRVADSLVAAVSGASVLEFLGDPAVQAEASGQSIVRRAGP